MKKIMFNDRYGLTNAVLSGRKTMTRRLVSYRASKLLDVSSKGVLIVEKRSIPEGMDYHKFAEIWAKQPGKLIFESGHEPVLHQPKDIRPEIIRLCSKYEIGETIAIAQSYENLANSKYCSEIGMMETPSSLKKEFCGAGWNNKMFVKAEYMPHSIEITDIKIERLQDISDEDCLKEGIVYDEPFSEIADPNVYAFPVRGKKRSSTWRSPSPRIAFENLIRHMMGKGIWDENPWVFAYSFKLVK